MDKSGAQKRKKRVEIEAAQDPLIDEKTAACTAAFSSISPPPPGLGKLVWTMGVLRCALAEIDAAEPPASDEHSRRIHTYGSTVAQLSERARDEQDLLTLLSELGVNPEEGDILGNKSTQVVESTIYTLNLNTKELYAVIKDNSIIPKIKRSKLNEICRAIARLGTPGYYQAMRRAVDRLQGR
jgi:hypothetical protein